MKRNSIILNTVVVGFFILFAATMVSCAKRGVSSIDFYHCDPSQVILDDGDSFSCGKEPIRILGIDTPEIIHKEHGIFEDQEMGRQAAAFTADALAGARGIVIIRGGRDPYGRTLAHVLVDGELLASKLIRAGLAYENVSRYGDNGLPEFALEIIEAWKALPKPTFDDPHEWRKKHKKK